MPPRARTARWSSAPRRAPRFASKTARWAQALRALEGAHARALLITALFVAFGGAVTWRYIPEVTYHVSQRHIFETYTERADEGEPLLRYQIPEREGSLYLEGVPAISSSRALLDRMKAPERFFAVAPRDRLARINYTMRREQGRNVPVLNARSSKLLLLSNALEEGEENQNYLTPHILEVPEGELPEGLQHEVTFPTRRASAGT